MFEFVARPAVARDFLHFQGELMTERKLERQRYRTPAELAAKLARAHALAQAEIKA